MQGVPEVCEKMKQRVYLVLVLEKMLSFYVQ